MPPSQYADPTHKVFYPKTTVIRFTIARYIVCLRTSIDSPVLLAAILRAFHGARYKDFCIIPSALIDPTCGENQL